MIYEADQHGKNITEVETKVINKVCSKMEHNKRGCELLIKSGVKMILSDEKKGYTSYDVCQSLKLCNQDSK